MELEAIDLTGANSASAIAVPVAEKAAASSTWLRVPKGPLKIGLAAAILAIGSYGIFLDENDVTSSDAIVSAYVVTVRTPIDGMVEGLSLKAGDRVTRGETLAEVRNPRVDEQVVVDLVQAEARAQGQMNALIEERQALVQQRSDLLDRSSSLANGIMGRIRLEVAENERLLAGKDAALAQARIDAERGKQLHESGIISNAEFEKLETQLKLAVEDDEAEKTVLTELRGEVAAAKAGTYIERGSNEIDISRQRSDDISLRLADMDQSIAALRSQAKAATEGLGIERSHMALMKQATLVAPISGLLWKPLAMQGERVAAGDAVADFVDCAESFVIAKIPQNRVPDILVGQRARIRLSGESQERSGVVRAVSGGKERDDNRKLAATIASTDEKPRATVFIDLDREPGRGECAVGRTASVVLPADGGNAATRWIRANF